MNSPKLATWLIAITVSLAAVGCEEMGGADDDADRARQFEERAAAEPPRATFSFGYIHSLDGIEPGGPVAVEGDDFDIEIEQAYLIVSAIEAHMCDAQGTEHGGAQGRLRPLFELLVPSARAHVPSSATRLGIPFVEDLFAEGKARIVGEIAPPLGRYCELHVVVAPADDDVMNLTDLSTEEIEHKSLYLRGRWRRDDGKWRDFSSTSDARRVVELEAIDPNTGDTPIELDDPDQSIMLLLDKDVSPALFDDLTPDDLDKEAADIVLERLEDRLHIREFKGG